MTPDQIFSLANAIVLPAWLLLMVAPEWRWTSRFVIGVVVTILSLFYVFFVFRSLQPGDLESFGSLEGITQLFRDKEAVLAGWIHYLAFDLMVGWFIVFDAGRNQLNRFLIIPCLLFTFMLGPSGLLLYLLIRFVVRKRYFVGFEA